MGIVAFCPNGHRIKVKDELAGRKGICPTCAARFRIPWKDAKPDVAAGTDALERPPMARVVSLDPQAAAALPTAFALDDADTVDAAEPVVEAADAVTNLTPLDDEAAGDEPSATGPVVSGTRVDEAPADESHPIHAALDERPDLAWCFAVRGGMPSAPLDIAAMRTWLESGAASANHVVWRQDWPEWRPIQEVFPDAIPPGPPGWP